MVIFGKVGFTSIRLVSFLCGELRLGLVSHARLIMMVGIFMFFKAWSSA
jgi:hypothetical protein